MGVPATGNSRISERRNRKMAERLEVSTQTITLQEIRRREREERRADVLKRLMAVRLAAEDQLTRKEIAKVISCHPNRLAEWIRRFNEAGFDGLESQPGKGRKPLLSKDQIETLIAWVKDGPRADRNGFEEWSIPRLCQLIEREFRIHYTPNGVYYLLQRLGLMSVNGKRITWKTDRADAEESEQLAANGTMA